MGFFSACVTERKGSGVAGESYTSWKGAQAALQAWYGWSSTVTSTSTATAKTVTLQLPQAGKQPHLTPKINGAWASGAELVQGCPLHV